MRKANWIPSGRVARSERYSQSRENRRRRCTMLNPPPISPAAIAASRVNETSGPRTTEGSDDSPPTRIALARLTSGITERP